MTVARILREPVPDLRVQGVPGALAEVVERLMAKEPADRPASAADTAALLQAVAARDRPLGDPARDRGRAHRTPPEGRTAAPEAATSVVDHGRRQAARRRPPGAARPALRPARLVAARGRVAPAAPEPDRRRALGARARPPGTPPRPAAVPGGRPTATGHAHPPWTPARPGPPPVRRPPRPPAAAHPRRSGAAVAAAARPAGPPPRWPGLADRRRGGRVGGRRRARHDVRAARPHLPARPGRPHRHSDAPPPPRPRAADVRSPSPRGRGRPRHHAPGDRRCRPRARRLRHRHQRTALLRLVRAAEPGQPDREEGRAGLDRRRVDAPRSATPACCR